MRKILLFFTFFFIAFVPFSTKAYTPPVLPDTSVVPDFLSTVAQNEIVNDSRVYAPTPDINNINMIVNGRSISDSMQYTYIDNADILTEMEFYDANGRLVDKDDTYTVYGNSDISPFMFVAEKNTGEMLNQNVGGQYVSTLIGGSDLSVSFPEFVVRDLTMSGVNNINRILDAIDVAKQQDMIIYGNSLTNSDKEFLSEYRFYCKYESEWVTFYVPNACSLNTVVKTDLHNIYSYHGSFGVYDQNALQYRVSIYTNDPSEVYFGAGDSRYTGLKEQTNVVYGTTFSYVSRWTNSVIPLYSSTGATLDMELPTQAQYNQYKNTVGDSVYLTPVDDVTDTPDENIYNYSVIIQNPPSRVQHINNSYNYEGDTNYNNYPVFYNYEYPTYPVTNNYATNIYNYYTTPQEGEIIGNITDPVLPENIPILSNLEKRFPFSIPFDMYKMLKGLSVPRETPVIDISFVIPRANIEWDIYYDLAPFDDTARLFRILFLISYIIGLAYFSYDHFFGR